MMSALPPKADMCGATKDVRFVPKADIRSGPYKKKVSPGAFALPQSSLPSFRSIE